jgi:hypothetical protein
LCYLIKCRNTPFATVLRLREISENRLKTGRLVKQVDLRGSLNPDGEESGFFQEHVGFEKQVGAKTACAPPGGYGGTRAIASGDHGQPIKIIDKGSDHVILVPRMECE